MSKIIDFAIELSAQKGFKVFPVHSIKNGQCSCEQLDCSSKGKHPMTSNGFKSASNTPSEVKKLFLNKAQANIGIETGKPSGIIVIDVDPRNGGDLELSKLKANLGEDKFNTLTVKTGGGGLHYYFAYPEGSFRFKKTITQGIDIKSDGGYVLAANSNHLSGKNYHYIDKDQEIKALPLELLDLVIHVEAVAEQQNLSNAYNQVSYDQAREMLSFIDKYPGHDIWMKIVFGLTNEFGPIKAKQLVEEWSADYKSKGRYLDNLISRSDGKITIGTVIHYAFEAGFKFNAHAQSATPKLFSKEDIDRRVKNLIVTKAKMNFKTLPQIVQDFLDWAKDSTFAADEFIALGFYLCVPPLLGNKFVLDFPSGDLKPHLWLACIGNSSTGKTSGLNIAANLMSEVLESILQENTRVMKKYVIDKKKFDKEILEKNSKRTIDDEPIRPKLNLFQLPAITSMQRLLEILAYNDPTGIIFVPSELSIVLSDWKNDRNDGLAHIHMSLFDSSTFVPTSSYKNSEDLPPIKDPSVTIAGASTPKSFLKRFSEEDFYSGNIQRWLFAKTSSKKQKKPFPLKRSAEGREAFLKFLKKILDHKLRQSNVFSFSLSQEARQLWELEYEKLAQSFIDDNTDDYVISCLERIKDCYALKFALINEVMNQISCEKADQHFKPVISKLSLEQALELTKYFMQSLIDLICDMKNSRVVERMNKIVKELRRKNKYSCNLNNLKTKLNYSRHPDDFDRALELLEDLELISIDQVTNGSNNKMDSNIISLHQEFTTVQKS